MCEVFNGVNPKATPFPFAARGNMGQRFARPKPHQTRAVALDQLHEADCCDGDLSFLRKDDLP